MRMRNATELVKKCLLTAFAVLIVLPISTSLLSAQITAAKSLNTPLVAGPNRPGNIPQGYVITPFGYFHPSCVQSIAEGETLLADGRVQHVDGTVEGNIAVCNYLRYKPDGSPMAGATAKQQTPEVIGWIDDASITPSSANESYGGMVATWVVPPQPRGQDGQVLFFFPGLEDINNVESILQPVLAWAGGQWTIANWNCCLNNITTESTQVDVRPGDEIVGSITENCRPGTLSCATWNVFSKDLATGKSTTLSHTPSEGQVFNWAFGGVLEPYYVVACDDYPPDHHETFQVLLLDKYLRPVSDAKWTESSNTTQTPQCNYGVKATPYAVELYY
jgi:hypothetical protein